MLPEFAIMLAEADAHCFAASQPLADRRKPFKATPALANQLRLQAEKRRHSRHTKLPRRFTGL